MESLSSLIFSDMTTLTPATILEFFIILVVVEFIGILINFVKGR